MMDVGLILCADQQIGDTLFLMELHVLFIIQYEYNWNMYGCIPMTVYICADAASSSRQKQTCLDITTR